MTVVGGIDIGNSTTEVVIGSARAGAMSPQLHRIVPTRGAKGADASLEAAADAVLRAERECGLRCDAFAVSPLQAVETTVTSAPDHSTRAAPIVEDLARDSATPFGAGVGIGTFVPLAELRSAAGAQPIVVGVSAHVDFAQAAAALRQGIERGLSIAGVVCEGDDATLIGNRLPAPLPIVDEVELRGVATGERLAIEVARDRSPRLADAFALRSTFSLPQACLDELGGIARQLTGRASLALVSRPHDDVGRFVVDTDTGEVIAAGVVTDVNDRFAVSFADVDDGVWVRSGRLRADRIPVASMSAGGQVDPTGTLARLLGRAVIAPATESSAAAVGALSSPGCPSTAAVCDVGGGTIDIVTAAGDSVVAAGAGELLTAATATAMRWPTTLAEAALRHASFRVQSPHVAHDELGRRRWLDRPAPALTIGRLCIEPDGEICVLCDDLAPEQWFGIRRAVKRVVIAANLERITAAVEDWPRAVVVAGGVAEDPEIVAMIAERFRARRTVVGRANVAGRLGPRGAVAWGQVLLAAQRGASIAA